MKRIAFIVAAIITTGCATNNFEKGNAAYQNKQYRLAAKHYAVCARQGDPTCINNLGYIHELYGNKEKAIAHYTLAARFGQEYAINNLKKHGEPVPDVDLRQPSNQQDSVSLLEVLNAVVSGYNSGSNRNRTEVIYCDSSVTGNSVNTVCTK